MRIPGPGRTGQLTQTIERVQSALFPGLRVRGVVLTMFDPRTNLATDVVREVKNHFPGQVFESIVPRSIRLASAFVWTAHFGLFSDPRLAPGPMKRLQRNYCKAMKSLLIKHKGPASYFNVFCV